MHKKNWNAGVVDLDVIRGLTPVDFESLPFIPKRIFYVSGSGGEHRGKHAHWEDHQILICLNGRIDLIMDDGINRPYTYFLTINQALYLPPLIWSEQYYVGEKSILMCLCKFPYKESDYIRDYNLFSYVTKCQKLS